MPNRNRKRLSALFAPATAAAIIATIALPASSDATPTGSQPLSASNLPLSCVIGPGTFNLQATIDFSITATAPMTVAPNDPLTLSDVMLSLTVPANLISDLTAAGATTASGTLSDFGFDATETTTPSVNAAKPALTFGPGMLVSGQALTAPVPATGAITVPLGAVTGADGTTAAISLDSTPAYTGTGGSFTPTGKGIVATVTGHTAGTGPSSMVTEAVDCNAPATPLGTVAIAGPATAKAPTTSKKKKVVCPKKGSKKKVKGCPVKKPAKKKG